MIEDVLKFGKLYDFYGNLLSESQKRTVELYYLEDFSINEIGDFFSVSKQTVFETLKRGEKNLENYEKKLGLVARFEAERKIIPKLRKALDELKDKLDGIENLLDDIEEEGIPDDF